MWYFYSVLAWQGRFNYQFVEVWFIWEYDNIVRTVGMHINQPWFNLFLHSPLSFNEVFLDLTS
jgi:hypothetical protein